MWLSTIINTTGTNVTDPFETRILIPAPAGIFLFETLNLNPKFNTKGSLLILHTDGNNPGTLFCIGIGGNAHLN